MSLNDCPHSPAEYYCSFGHNLTGIDKKNAPTKMIESVGFQQAVDVEFDSARIESNK